MSVEIFRKIYWKLEKAIVPELTSSQYHYKETLFANLPDKKFAWLDLGCGHQVFAEWMTVEQDEMLAKTGFAVGIDLDLPALKAHKGISAKVYADLTAIPLKDKSFDVITANMVVEHLNEPEKVFSEVCRLLRTDGVFVFHTTNARNPFLQAAAKIPQDLKNSLVYVLEDRKAEDVFPTHYKVNRPQDVKAVATQTGFDVEQIKLVSTSAFTQVFTPLALLELLFIRMLRQPSLEHLRTNLICVLRKSAEGAKCKALGGTELSPTSK
jgi:ubiquinone/menaquinone biosynthesis C-methylase UbiE